MSESPAVTKFWADFLSKTGRATDTRYIEAFYFCDNEPDAIELAEPVLQGQKRATASLVKEYKEDGEKIPVVGDLSIVTNWDGKPLAVIETTDVKVVPFNEVTAEFAATEGEGDSSLEYWSTARTTVANAGYAATLSAIAGLSR